MTSYVSLGIETLVNAKTPNAEGNPSIAVLSDGGWVVCWRYQQNGADYDIYLQRYDADGNAVGAAMRVNATTAGDQEVAKVAALADGGWVTVWTSPWDAGGSDIFMQRYSASGAKVGGETRVSPTSGWNLTGSITALPTGGWVVVWSSGDQGPVSLQRYSASGATVGSVVQVSSAGRNTIVATRADGGWEVCWDQGVVYDYSTVDVYKQAYLPTGAAYGPTTRVNTTTADSQALPAVATLTNGDYVVCWQSTGQDGAGLGVYQQRYHFDGSTAGGEQQVNATTAGNQMWSVIAALADGGWVVSWTSASSSGYDVFQQRYDANGGLVDGERHVNLLQANDEYSAALAALPDGGWAEVWVYSDSASYGVYQNRFLGEYKLLTTGSDTIVGDQFAMLVDGVLPDDINAGDSINGGGGVDIIRTDIDTSGSYDFTIPAVFTGFEILLGGAGDESFVFDNTRLAQFQSIDGGAGVDSLFFRGTNLAGVTFKNMENLYTAGNTVFGIAAQFESFNTIAANPRLPSSSVSLVMPEPGILDLHAQLQGRSATILGSPFGDSITTSDGDDTINGGLGADSMAGGLGDDTYVVDNSGDAIVEATHQGNDTAECSVTYALGAAVSIELLETTNPYGTSAIDLTGNELSQAIIGNNGRNMIVGGGGADVIDGGGVSDTAVFGAFASDATIMRNLGGTVTVAIGAATDILKNVEWIKFLTSKISVFIGEVTRDFGFDGHSDVLLRNASGVTFLWTMNGATVANAAPTSVQADLNWQIKSVADFNGDGNADLLWAYHNASNSSDPLNGVSYISLQNGASSTSGSGVVQRLSSVWQAAGTGDFNGDGMADVLYRNSGTGQTYLDIMNGSSVNWAASGFTSQQVTDANWRVAAVADFNGDGNADVLWRYSNAANAADPLNGALYGWQMNGTNVTGAGLLSQQAGKNWQVAGTGDFNGDGNIDILFRYQNASNASDALNGVAYVDFMNGTTVTSGAPTQWQVDNSWAIASIGDYNGDGMSDILWQQTSTGKTYIWQMNGANVTSGAFTSQQAGAGWSVQNGVLIG